MKRKSRIEKLLKENFPYFNITIIDNSKLHIGHNNFDIIHYDYYRDSNVMIEALKANEYDFRSENISKEWATAYNDLNNNNNFIKEEINHELPQGMQAFIYNIRKDIFKNIELRKALALAFDFEWTNKTLFYGQYIRSNSYFSNSELASSGLPTDEELKIIEQLNNDIPKKMLKEVYNPGKTDGSGNNRKNLRQAMQILKKANYKYILENFDAIPENLNFGIKLSTLESFVKSNGIKTTAIDINSTTHTLIEDVTEPTKFHANAFTYIDGTWAILTEAVENMNKGAKLYDVPEIEVEL